jgi:hypothetical protein
VSELDYGPNGGLVFAFEYLLENMDWMFEELGDFSDDYLIIDCPGQIELYSHLQIMPKFAAALQRAGYQVCSVHLLDSLLISDTERFLSGVLMALSAMVALELPHVNLLSKIDLLADKRALDQFLDPDTDQILARLQTSQRSALNEKLKRLNSAVVSLLESYSFVAFLPFDITDEESIDQALAHVDNALQFGEDQEPREVKEPVDRETEQSEREPFADPDVSIGKDEADR